MNETILTQGNLIRGIEMWKNYHKHWDADFHNNLYSRLFKMRSLGFTAEYLSVLIDRLAEWKATRGSSKQDIFENGLQQLPFIAQQFQRILRIHNGVEPDLSTTSWSLIKPLFIAAFRIKQNRSPSPVFASKFCHFILPNAFMVTDRQVIAVEDDQEDYEDYWQACKEDWTSCAVKEKLILILGEEIGKDLIDNYPFSTKISKLCIMGAQKGSDN